MKLCRKKINSKVKGSRVFGHISHGERGVLEGPHWSQTGLAAAGNAAGTQGRLFPSIPPKPHGSQTKPQPS